MKKRIYFSRTAFFDLLFNMLLVFIVLFVIALVQINPEAKKESEGIELNAKFLIIVSWPEDIYDDVDVYVRDPASPPHIVYFQRREDGFMHLERDDRGMIGDRVFMPDGSVQYVTTNEEHVIFRDIIRGEYIINVHMYSKNSEKETPVTVRLIKLVGKDTEVASRDVTLYTRGDEITVFRFTLDMNGNVSNLRKPTKPETLPIRNFATSGRRL